MYNFKIYKGFLQYNGNKSKPDSAQNSPSYNPTRHNSEMDAFDERRTIPYYESSDNEGTFYELEDEEESCERRDSRIYETALNNRFLNYLNFKRENTKS